jgi:hypothetical protein
MEIAMSSVRSRLIGAWRMADWKIFKGESSIDPPFGPAEDCGGILVYSPEGIMSAVLSRKNREPFQDASLDGGTEKEKVAAYETIISYTGTFSVDEESSTVLHHVEYATFPNFVGQKLPRICIFEGDKLKLDTPPMYFGGELLASYLLWERVAS